MEPRPSASLPLGVVFEQASMPTCETWTLRATQTHERVGSGAFDEPRAFAAVDAASFGEAATFVGFAFTQFAVPVFGRLDQPFDFAPASNLDSPAAIVPLLIQQPGANQVTLLAPLDSWHEQIIAVRQDEAGIHEFRWGWHGDLMEVPEGFSSTLGIFTGASASKVFAAWGRHVLAAADTRRPDRAANPFTSKLSYWTDNGAAYWYRTEPGQTIIESLAAKKAELDELGIAVGAWEIDSWYYQHEVSRPVAEVGYLSEVPPTGMLTWEPRPDVLPDGMAPLADAVGGAPLGFHARHISAKSPYLATPETGEWWVDIGAHPKDPTFFDRWFADAKKWGATAIEQDWMLHVWFGVRQLREAPGRALRWQQAMDRAAAAHDMGLIWCMATPADLMATVELANVIAVRTSDDYRFADDPAFLWRWYLTVNRFAGALDLATFKDCFFSMADSGSSPIDGDPHAEVEALLSAFSAGIAGIGDRLGRTDPHIIARLCEPDGQLVQPDRPLAIADQSFFADPAADDALLWAHTHTETLDGVWHYVVALHAAPQQDPITDRYEIAGDADWLIYNWRTGDMVVSNRIETSLDHRDWALFVFCPISTAATGQRQATIGDTRRYATMGQSRLEPDPDRVAASWTA